MQTKKIITAAIIMIMAIPSIVKAAVIDIICPEEIKENTDFTCNIRTISDININNIIVKYRYSSEISFKSIELKDNWTFLVEDNPSSTKIGVKNSTEKVGDVSIADITFSSSGAIGKTLHIEFYDFDATNENADVISFNNNIVRKNIRVISNEQKNNESSTNNTNTTNNNTIQSNDSYNNTIQPNNNSNSADNTTTDQIEENKVEEKVTDNTTKKEQKEKNEQKEKTKDTKQAETTHSKKNNKKIISIVLIIVSVGIIVLAIVVAKKNWNTLYKK